MLLVALGIWLSIYIRDSKLNFIDRCLYVEHDKIIKKICLTVKNTFLLKYHTVSKIIDPL